MRKLTAIQIALGTLAGAALVTAGAVAGLKYWTGSDFSPSKSTRELKTNQVLFQQEPDNQPDGGKSENEDSSRWEKQDDAEKQESPQIGEGNFLFQTDRKDQASSTGGIVGDTTQTGGQGNNPAPDHVFDIVDNGGNSAGTDGTGTGDGKEDGKGDAGEETPTEPTWPEVLPPDPEPDKDIPSDYDPNYDYIYKEDEDFTPALDPWGFSDYYVDFSQDYYGTYTLYAGQTVGEKELFASLNAAFFSYDESNGIYYRHVLTSEHYGKYIRITGVSFDLGDTWIEEFPVTIPEELDYGLFQISIEYRFKQSSDKWYSASAFYTPAQSKVMVLSEIPKSDADSISAASILNQKNQYPPVGSSMNLFAYQAGLLLGSDYSEDQLREPLTRLFTGWYEDGVRAPWRYCVTTGRHVLLPGGSTPVGDGTAMLSAFILNEDMESDPVSGETVFLQTLVEKNADADGVLNVQKNIQAVHMNGQTVRVLHLPDTVLYIPNETNCIQVTDAFAVEPGNPQYSSKDGLLMNADQTEILGVPTAVTKLKIGAEITQIAPLRSNALEELELEEREDLPEIQYECLSKGVTLTVPEDLIGALFVRDGEEISARNITVWGNSGKEYHTSGMFLLDGDNGIRGVIRDDQQMTSLPEETKTICAGALQNSTVLTTLMMPPQMEAPTLEAGCFADSALTKIICGTKAQAENLRAQMRRLGIEGVTVTVAENKGGFTYAELGDGTVRLISADEKDIGTFDGIDGLVISEIGNGAFAKCENLRWVTLPAGVKLIEESAFSGCTSLEGLLLEGDTEGGITVQQNALEGCANLRIFASNVKQATFQGSLGDGLSYVGFCPQENSGYPYTEPFHKVAWFRVDGCTYDFYKTASGQQTVYGFENGEPTVLISMERGASGKISLPETTNEIAPRAFEGLQNTFWLNWEAWSGLQAIDYAAFRDSALEGKVNLKNAGLVMFDTEAFLNCTGVTGFAATGGYYGASVFEGCTELETADLGQITGTPTEEGTLTMGMFGGCEKLTSITVDNQEPPKLTIRSPGTKFYFIGSDPDNLLHVPAGSEEAYASSWTQSYTGYATEEELRDAYWWLSEEELEKHVESDLLAAGNEVRRVIDGLEPIQDTFQVVENNGILTLASVTKPLEGAVTLDEKTLNIDGYLDYIASGAFAKCPGLTQITIPGTEEACLSGVYSGAFATGGEALELEFQSPVPPALILESDGSFTFGLADEKMTLSVPDDAVETYLAKWKANLSGYVDYNAALAETREEHPDWNETRVQQTTDSQLLAGENRLRAMMGLSKAEDPLTHFGYEAVRNGFRLNAVPTYVESVTLDSETMGLEPGSRLLEINAGSFQNCDLLKKVTVPDTVDAITSRAFTCAAENLTLDMTAWDKEKTPPTLVLLDMDRDGVKEPFTFGLTKENAQVTVLVRDAETKAKFVKAWAPFFAGADSLETLTQQLLNGQQTADRTEEEQAQARASAQTQAESAIRQAENLLNTLITVPTPPEEASSGENGVE